MVHCATLQLVITTVVVILCLIRDGTSCEFEDCKTVQQHINATGENLIMFEPCLNDPDCLQHCLTQYDIVAVNLTSSQPDQEVKLYWNSLEVLLMILPGSGTTSNVLEPYDMVVDIEYVRHERPEHKEKLEVTITLKPISIELHTNIKYREVKEGHRLELECIIRGAIDDNENVKVLIHHESEELNCTTVESQNKIVCKRKIPSFSEAESGKYFCSTTIGDEYFSSKVEDIKLDNSTSANGLGMPIKIAIGGGAFGVVVVIILIISLVVSIVINCKLKKQLTQRNDGRQQRQGNGGGGAPAGNGVDEEEPLIPEENHPPHSYEAVADDLERSGTGLRDSPQSNASSGSRTSEFVRTNQDGGPSKLASIHQSAGASNKPTSSPQVLKEGNQDTGF